MSNKYITLQKANGEQFKFIVLLQGFDPGILRKVKVETAIDGTTDASFGSTKRQWVYNLKVFTVQRELGYGTKDDLENLFLLNDPGSVDNSPVLTLKDHDEKEYQVIIINDYHKANLTIMLEGSEAAFIVQTILREM